MEVNFRCENKGLFTEAGTSTINSGRRLHTLEEVEAVI